METNHDDLKRRLDRLQAVQDCRNLMGAYSLLHTAYRNKEFVELWANRDDDVLLMPWGAYYGIDGVRECYLEHHGDREDMAAEDNPQLHGGMFMHCMDTEIIEVAEDGQTARAFWFDPGHETYVEFKEDDGKLARDDWDQGIPHTDWCWGKYAVNFIMEDGVWKFWQMQLFPLTRQSFYTCWTHNKPYPGHKFAMGGPLPEQIWEYADDLIYPADRPDPPIPYKTFDMKIHGILVPYENS